MTCYRVYLGVSYLQVTKIKMCLSTSYLPTVESSKKELLGPKVLFLAVYHSSGVKARPVADDS